MSFGSPVEKAALALHTNEKHGPYQHTVYARLGSQQSLLTGCDCSNHGKPAQNIHPLSFHLLPELSLQGTWTGCLHLPDACGLANQSIRCQGWATDNETLVCMPTSMQEPWNARLLQFYVYGEGFRGARAAYLKRGLKAVVYHVCQYKSLPNA